MNNNSESRIPNSEFRIPNSEFMDGMSMNLEQANMDKLKAAFPECFAEGKLDIDKLLSLCGEYIDNDFEKYKFEWKGKAESLRLAQKRSTGTLRPCPEDSVNWDTTQNLYIEGDNLEVLKLLQTAYFRKVKMIYIDPPYNTGNDFVYEDDFADPMARYKEVTQQTTKSNPETMGRFHTNWLNMMYPRLRLASNLLRDDGVIFISIDDNEVTNLRKVCDEVFGEENFIAEFIWKSRQNKDNRNLTGVSIDHEYILTYSKTNYIRSIKGAERKTEQYTNPDNDPRGPWASANMAGLLSADQRPNCHYDLINPATGINYGKPEMGWRYDKKTMSKLIEENRILWPDTPNGRPRKKSFLSEISQVLPGYSSIVGQDLYTRTATKEVQQLFEGKYFDYPKPLDLIKDFVNQTTTNDDIILDFFSGSATTAHAVMQLNKEDGGNRKFICVQLPEVCEENTEAYKAGYKTICEIGKERIRRAGKKLNAEFGNRNLELDLQMELDDNNSAFRTPHSELDIGFRVLKLDSSNLKTWDTTPVEEEQMSLFVERMNNMVNRVKTDRTDMDMVFEVMLKLGVQPTAVVEKKDVNGKTVYTVGNDSLLLICLAENVKPADVEAMAEFAPGKIVISRDSFADDTAMANAHYILRDRKIELKLV